MAPNHTFFGDVPALRGVNNPQVADPFTVLGVLPDGDEHLVVVDHRGGDDIVAVAATLFPLGILGVAVELPNQLPRFGLERIEPPVPSGKDDLRLAADYAIGGGSPLPVKDAVARRSVFPDELARVAVDRQKTGRPRRGDVDVALVHSVRCVHEKQIADDKRRGGCHVVRKHAQLVIHVERPHNVAVNLGSGLLVLVGTIVLAVEKALGVESQHFRSIGHVIDPIAHHRR